MLSHIRTLTLRASFFAEQKGELPNYLGSTIRGIMGHAFRDSVCTSPKTECHTCMQRFSCANTRYFSNTGQAYGALNPYVIYVHTRGKQQWEKGDNCIFDITLLGDMVSDANSFMDAIVAMSNYGWGVNRIHFRLEYILLPASEQIVWCQNISYLHHVKAIPFMTLPKQAKQVLVRFLTPVRILKSQQLCETLDFCDFIQSICRRIELVSNKYTSKNIEWDMEPMMQEAVKIETKASRLQVVEFERYSMTRRTKKLELPGMEGWILYEGNLTPFVPMLEAGRVLHAGRATTIGFGAYELSYDEGEKELE